MPTARHDRASAIFRGTWDVRAPDESDGDDEKFRQRMTLEELQDLA
jgi:hypothetical protein